MTVGKWFVLVSHLFSRYIFYEGAGSNPGPFAYLEEREGTVERCVG